MPNISAPDKITPGDLERISIWFRFMPKRYKSKADLTLRNKLWDLAQQMRAKKKD